MNSIPRLSASRPNDALLARIERALIGGLRASSDFDLNPGVAAPVSLREAAVLLPLIETPKGWHMVLTRRAAHLSRHPGQIAFPGGKVDDGESLVEAALREADEEIGLTPARVRLLGELPAHRTVTGFLVTPVIGVIAGQPDFTPQSDEVDEVFQVPLSHLLDLANFRIEGRVWGGERRHYYTIPVGPWYIWGATARILRQLAEGAKA